MALTDPSKEETLGLFQDIEQHFPSHTLGEDKWQILAVSFELTMVKTSLTFNADYLRLLRLPEADTQNVQPISTSISSPNQSTANQISVRLSYADSEKRW